ncbi:MAG TPA: cytochrome c biogenesis protein ResB [Desulfobacteraceae bacterium]|nr:cytochrome c biogenesis protein ResB [Desulfobacteraceae bacterium]
MQAYHKSLWSFFSSIKLAVVLLILIALTSIAGTLLPQNEGAAEFVSRLNPAAENIWRIMGLDNIYHSWWFRLLLAALALNLTFCTLERLPGALKTYRSPLKPDRQKPFQALPPDQTVSVASPPAEASRAISGILTRRYSRTENCESGGSLYFAAEKGRLSIFGVHMVHASVLLILAGALIGSFLGFQAYVNIPEGGATGTVYLRATREPLKLGFVVQCNAFNVEFYETGAPKEYRSELVFKSENSEPLKQIVKVNHPAVYNGVKFYQSTYGTMRGGIVRLKAEKLDEPGVQSMIEAVPGGGAPLPGGKGMVRIVDVRDRFIAGGTAVLLSVDTPDEKDITFWIFENPEAARSSLPAPMALSRKFDPSAAEPFHFQFLDMERRYYTGLQANKDPGVPLVWSGFILIIVGFLVAFFHPHRRIRARIVPAAGETSISIAGWSKRNPMGLEQEIQTILAEIVHRLSPGGRTDT